MKKKSQIKKFEKHQKKDNGVFAIDLDFQCLEF